MHRTRIRTLVAIAVVVAALSWAGFTWAQQASIPLAPVSWAAIVVLLLLAVFIVWWGWPVRQYLKGKHDPVDPIRAARTVVLAKACALGGAGLTGFYGGQVVLWLGELKAPTVSEFLWPAVFAALSAIVLVVAALIVEWFCRVPPPQDPDAERSGGSAVGTT